MTLVLVSFSLDNHCKEAGLVVTSNCWPQRQYRKSLITHHMANASFSMTAYFCLVTDSLWLRKKMGHSPWIPQTNARGIPVHHERATGEGGMEVGIFA